MQQQCLQSCLHKLQIWSLALITPFAFVWCLTDTCVSVCANIFNMKAVWKEDAVENYRLLGLVFCSTLIKCRLFYFPAKMSHEPCWAAGVAGWNDELSFSKVLIHSYGELLFYSHSLAVGVKPEVLLTQPLAIPTANPTPIKEGSDNSTDLNLCWTNGAFMAVAFLWNSITSCWLFPAESFLSLSA